MIINETATTITVAIRKQTTVEYLGTMLSPLVSKLCLNPQITAHINALGVSSLDLKYVANTEKHEFEMTDTSQNSMLGLPSDFNTIMQFEYASDDPQGRSESRNLAFYLKGFVSNEVCSFVSLTGSQLEIKTDNIIRIDFDESGEKVTGNIVGLTDTVKYNIVIDKAGSIVVGPRLSTITTLDTKLNRSGTNIFGDILGDFNETAQETKMKNQLSNCFVGIRKEIQSYLNNPVNWGLPAGKKMVFKSLNFNANGYEAVIVKDNKQT